VKINFEYRNPTPTHCDVAIFVNGAFTGTLTLRQEEIVIFSMILHAGCVKEFDSFLSSGKSQVEA
jgi:hypothetical protein